MKISNYIQCNNCKKVYLLALQLEEIRYYDQRSLLCYKCDNVFKYNIFYKKLENEPNFFNEADMKAARESVNLINEKNFEIIDKKNDEYNDKNLIERIVISDIIPTFKNITFEEGIDLIHLFDYELKSKFNIQSSKYENGIIKELEKLVNISQDECRKIEYLCTYNESNIMQLKNFPKYLPKKKNQQIKLFSEDVDNIFIKFFSISETKLCPKHIMKDIERNLKVKISSHSIELIEHIKQMITLITFFNLYLNTELLVNSNNEKKIKYDDFNWHIYDIESILNFYQDTFEIFKKFSLLIYAQYNYNFNGDFKKITIKDGGFKTFEKAIKQFNNNVGSFIDNAIFHIKDFDVLYNKKIRNSLAHRDYKVDYKNCVVKFDIETEEFEISFKDILKITYELNKLIFSSLFSVDSLFNSLYKRWILILII
ncbi:MAG: hypothetical protein ACRC5R_06270 [Mycoplasmatales bacterium]